MSVLDSVLEKCDHRDVHMRVQIEILLIKQSLLGDLILWCLDNPTMAVYVLERQEPGSPGVPS